MSIKTNVAVGAGLLPMTGIGHSLWWVALSGVALLVIGVLLHRAGR